MRKIRSSPIRAEHQRSRMLTAADSSAITATTTDKVTTRPRSPASTPSSMIRWKSSSGTTDSVLPATVATRNTTIMPVNGAP